MSGFQFLEHDKNFGNLFDKNLVSYRADPYILFITCNARFQVKSDVSKLKITFLS